ncbi:MAG: tRNA (guanosine(37)-N1)-methyltransferase TrmD [Gammaproteobacteria bacterium]|nr:tRNA (guanosine(37)-N1)-methyltransferase TrmD [Gammaproteobacteria bacterium]MYF03000.1 tRNA (guanosine(37)-N1)-methyltransferase TrmD [Gammaproteobacteria bacterium]MYI76525.1 tRNA (guanosine(37)-N1)-methyltransferase TrmD [Gammaproteobacteria bacterium]
MWLGVVTIFPDLVKAMFKEGVVGRAIERGDISFETINPRDYPLNSYGSVDDRPFGGGPGMVLAAEPLAACVQAARERVRPRTLKTALLSPQGTRFSQSLATKLSQLDALLLVAGRYEGVDERFITNYVDLEISIGDYVLSGGELAASVVVDVIGRYIEGTVNNPESIECESFTDDLLDCPQYTRPRVFEGVEVPEVLLSGDHRAVERWRHQQRIEKTWKRRPDLLVQRVNKETESAELRDCVLNAQPANLETVEEESLCEITK